MAFEGKFGRLRERRLRVSERISAAVTAAAHIHNWRSLNVLRRLEREIDFQAERGSIVTFAKKTESVLTNFCGRKTFAPPWRRHSALGLHPPTRHIVQHNRETEGRKEAKTEGGELGRDDETSVAGEVILRVSASEAFSLH